MSGLLPVLGLASLLAMAPAPSAAAATPALAPAPAPSPAPAGAKPSDPVRAAMQKELTRAMSDLKTEGFARPYYASAMVLDRKAVVLESANGALLPAAETRQRLMRVTVRVGSYALDNSGFQDQVGSRGAGDAWASFPLDDDPVAMRRTLWLAFDEAYKEAGATLAAKQAFLATQGASPKPSLGDFTRESPRVERIPIRPSLAPERARAVDLLARLGQVLAAPGAPSARLRVSLVEQSKTFIDSEGSDLEGGTPFVCLEAATWEDAPDGAPVRDLVMRYAPSLDGLGTVADLEKALTEMMASVRAQRMAEPLQEAYNGPVLFESEASASLFGSFLIGRIPEPREALSATGGGSGGSAGEWGSRLGSRVLSPLLTVVDDPTLEERGGVPLTGHFRFDFDGVFARPVKVITRGVLKDFVGTRWPRKGALVSNGHARKTGGPASNLGAVAMPSTILVTASGEGTVSRDAVRARFLEELKTRELPFGLVVRRMDDSSILELGATDWRETADFQGRIHEASELEMPLDIYQVTPDGKETRLRGVRFGNIPVEALKGVLAATPPEEGEAVFNTLLTFDASYTLVGPIVGAYVPISVVAPGAVLVDEMEMRPIPGPFRKKPIAAARAAAASSSR